MLFAKKSNKTLVSNGYNLIAETNGLLIFFGMSR